MSGALCLAELSREKWRSLPVLPRHFLFEGQVSSLLDDRSMWWPQGELHSHALAGTRF